MTAQLALDTSVAVPLLASTHDFHESARRWLDRRPAVLSGHAAAESYSVLTRMSGGNRRTPDEAAALIESWFGPSAVVGVATMSELPRVLADAGVTGGAVYDALVGLAARENDMVLATRDVRAKQTYDALGVSVEFVR